MLVNAISLPLDHGFGLDNTNQQKAENVYGQEKEQQDDAWASLTEKDILQADLWGNLPVIRRAKDAKPAAVECDLDQVSCYGCCFLTKVSL